jgi:hypothetical protein
MHTESSTLDSRCVTFFENLSRNIIELKKGQLPIYRGKLSALKREIETLKESKGEDDLRVKTVHRKIGGLEHLVRQTEREVNLGETLLEHPPRPDEWMLFGEVVDPVTGKGVTGARVELFDKAGRSVEVAGKKVTVTTDERGCFRLDSAQEGIRELLAKNPEVTVKVYDEAGKVIHVQSGIRPAIGGLDIVQVLVGEAGVGFPRP